LHWRRLRIQFLGRTWKQPMRESVGDIFSIFSFFFFFPYMCLCVCVNSQFYLWCYFWHRCRRPQQQQHKPKKPNPIAEIRLGLHQLIQSANRRGLMISCEVGSIGNPLPCGPPTRLTFSVVNEWRCRWIFSADFSLGFHRRRFNRPRRSK